MMMRETAVSFIRDEKMGSRCDYDIKYGGIIPSSTVAAEGYAWDG